jgi:hypothetical protein
MSSWELRRWKELDSDPRVATYGVQPLRIPYTFEGSRNYVPDALITYIDGSVVLEEIKPRPLMARPKNQAKFAAARDYCSAKGWEFRVVSYG